MNNSSKVGELLDFIDKLESDENIVWPEEVIVYHGTRTHMSADEIKKYGICAWESPGSAVITVMQALKKLGIDGNSETMEDAAMRACEWAANPQLSLTGYKSDACTWARNSPELVSFPAYLQRGGEDKGRKDVQGYLDENFGKPYRITLKRRLDKRDIYTPQDIHSGMKCISPEIIVEVEECK